MPKPIDSPQAPVFFAKPQMPWRSIYWTVGIVALLAAFLIPFDAASEAVGVLAGVALVVGVISAWLQRNAYKELCWVIHPDRLEQYDVVLQSKSEFSASTPWSNVKEAVYVPGKGVGLRLLDAELFYASFGVAQAATAWRRRGKALNKRYGTQLWIPENFLNPDPARFAALCSERINAHVGQIPPPSWPSFAANPAVMALRAAAAIAAVLLGFGGMEWWRHAHGLRPFLNSGFSGGLVAFAALFVMGMVNRFSRARLLLGVDGLLIRDQVGNLAFQSLLPYADIEAVLPVKGKGVGIRLSSSRAWFESFSDAKRGLEIWKRLNEQWRKSKNVDLWLPNYLLHPSPQRFAEELQAKLSSQPAAPAAASINFDTVEYAAQAGPSGVQCSRCEKKELPEYFELSGAIVCGDCAEKAGTARASGSPAGRFWKSLFWGGLGALGGGAVFAGVAIGTGYELGLISLLAGYLAGAGVKRGSDARGGWLYQSLAVAVAYFGITLAYLVVIVAAMMHIGAYDDSDAKPKAAPTQASAPPAPAPAPAAKAPQQQAQAQPATAQAQPAAMSDEEAEQAEAEASKGLPWYIRLLRRVKQVDPQEHPFMAIGLYLSLVLAFLVALPFIIGFESPISLFIIGIALYQAWKQNRSAPFELKGPFKSAPAAEGAA